MFSVAQEAVPPPVQEDGKQQPMHTAPGPRTGAAAAQYAVHEREYGPDAAAALAKMLRQLGRIGYVRAGVASLTAFERILGGICWLLERLVPREQARTGRVHWDLLFQPHARMKPRLGLAQEVVLRLEQLPNGCPIAIQPHQLLLQDFGDIGAIQQLVKWLIQQAKGNNDHAVHLAKIVASRSYLALQGGVDTAERNQTANAIKPEIVQLDQKFQPKRKWRYNKVHEVVDASGVMCAPQ